MNSVLQCLTHTPPLAELALSGRQLGGERDLVRLIQQHITKAFQSQSCFAPNPMASCLRVVNKRWVVRLFNWVVVSIRLLPGSMPCIAALVALVLQGALCCCVDDDEIRY